MRKVLMFFDRVEDRVRASLSRMPIIYALVGAIGIILMWKGVEETAKLVPFLYGPASFLLGALILLGSGLLVSFFVGDNIIISGIMREKKLVDKAEKEVITAEHSSTQEILHKL